MQGYAPGCGRVWNPYAGPGGMSGAGGAPGLSRHSLKREKNLCRNTVKKLRAEFRMKAMGARRQKASPSHICIAEAMQAPVGLAPRSSTRYRNLCKKKR